MRSFFLEGSRRFEDSKAREPLGFTRREAIAQLRSFTRGALAVCHWELTSFFRRPASYLLLLAALGVAAWAFTWLIALLARGGVALSQADDPIRQFLGPNVFLIGLCTLLVPLFTMNLVAEERRRATWEYLLTAPVSTGSVVVGKFAAAWTLWMTCLAPWLLYVLLLRTWNGGTRWLWGVIPWFDTPGLPFDLGPVVSAVIGLGVIGGSFVALGLLCSSLCGRPVSAALLSSLVMGLCLVLGLLPRLLEHWQFSESVVELAHAFSSWGQLEWFSRGTIFPRVIAAHLSLWIVILWGATRVSRLVDDG
ncbi:MAG: ABC transporter permease [Planctomycetaceae bacterium]